MIMIIIVRWEWAEFVTILPLAKVDEAANSNFALYDPTESCPPELRATLEKDKNGLAVGALRLDVQGSPIGCSGKAN